MFRQYALVSAPVVDEAGRLVGVITVDDVVHVIEEETEEDLMSLGGVGESDFHAPALVTAWRRLRWLVVTLINTIIASTVISQFDATIEQIVALAVLMPIVASMGGNAGMQVVTVTVRALATRDLSPAATCCAPSARRCWWTASTPSASPSSWAASPPSGSTTGTSASCWAPP